MVYQRGGYAAPADFGDHKLSRLTVGTRRQRHRDRFRVRSLITRGGGRPMSIYRRANILSVHLFDNCPLDIRCYTFA